MVQRFGGHVRRGDGFYRNKSGTERVLHSFSFNSGDGQKPYGTSVDVKGVLFGTTWDGGMSGDGTAFSITKSGKESVLHSFGSSGSDGVLPYAGLISNGGVLYGTTYGGGGLNYGTVFSITPSGKESVLYSFTGTPDGADPYSGLVNVKGKLYGTTQEAGNAGGEGTVFSITTSGKEAILHSFGPYFYGDGEEPYANLLNVNGTFYGTTERGGKYNEGCVFTVTTSGKESVLYSFGGSNQDGEEPNAALTNVHGTLYGTTSMGGANGEGTVFAITPSRGDRAAQLRWHRRRDVSAGFSAERQGHAVRHDRKRRREWRRTVRNRAVVLHFMESLSVNIDLLGDQIRHAIWSREPHRRVELNIVLSNNGNETANGVSYEALLPEDASLTSMRIRGSRRSDTWWRLRATLFGRQGTCSALPQARDTVSSSRSLRPEACGKPEARCAIDHGAMARL